MRRRNVIKSIGSLAGGVTASPLIAEQDKFRLRYILSSAMYGYMPLESILPQVTLTGSEAIDVWCKVHGNQREQIDKMGHNVAKNLLAKHKVKAAVFTRYPLGPFGLVDEMRKIHKNFDAEIIVCGTTGPSEVKGKEAKKVVSEFLEKMKPHVSVAEELGMTIAVENHSRQFLYHPDSLQYFAELNSSKNLGVALAPHHLHRFQDQIPAIIRDLGNANIPFMYFQEHSDGMYKKASKEIEMRQMPGFGGGLDYKPILRALKDIKYDGYCEIFMHPVPRGIPILPTIEEISKAINKSREYIESSLKEA
ncbi:MAG: TIM barrel protein [Verrucomicrobiota bacterium]|nr:TIM barrel protein [Verrucomicrobiota bacterium]